MLLSWSISTINPDNNYSISDNPCRFGQSGYNPTLCAMSLGWTLIGQTGIMRFFFSYMRFLEIDALQKNIKDWNLEAMIPAVSSGMKSSFGRQYSISDLV